MSPYHGSKNSWISTIFFVSDGHLHCQKWWRKVHCMGYHFVPVCNHAQENHTCQSLSFFFLPYLQDHNLLRSRNFATMATWHHNFSSLLPFTLPLFCYSNFHRVMFVIHMFKCIYCIELNSKPCSVIDLQHVVAKHHFRKGGKLKFSRDSTHD